MHWKTKRKILRATKLYVTEVNGDSNLTSEIRIQIDKKEYVFIDFYISFPKNISYLSLIPNGFNYKVGIDPRITIFGKTKILQVLRNSKNLPNIDVETIDKVISLVTEMQNVSHR